MREGIISKCQALVGDGIRHHGRGITRHGHRKFYLYRTAVAIVCSHGDRGIPLGHWGNGESAIVINDRGHILIGSAGYVVQSVSIRIAEYCRHRVKIADKRAASGSQVLVGYQIRYHRRVICGFEQSKRRQGRYVAADDIIGDVQR